METESVKMKAPLIFCEILAHGLEENKPKIKKMLEKLQRLIDKSKTNQKRVRVLWYVDNGEKTIEEKKEWLINESHCIFYVFTPEDHIIPDNFISNFMIGVNMFDRAMKLMRKDGVVMKKNTPKENVEETQAEAPLEILD
jgi:sugar-specific transcriptional regulator TrmB